MLNDNATKFVFRYYYSVVYLKVFFQEQTKAQALQFRNDHLNPTYILSENATSKTEIL